MSEVHGRILGVGLVGTLVLLSACEDGGDRGPAAAMSTGPVPPTVVQRDGIELASLESLPSLLDESFRWRVRTVRRVRTVDAGGEPRIFDPAAAVPLAGDRLLVWDPHADRPLVVMDLSADSVVARFGRGGQGPGELSDYVAVAASPTGLRVLDPANRQLHAFGLEGTRLGSAPLDAPALLLKTIPILDADAFVAEILAPERGPRGTHDLVRVDGVSGALRTLATLPDWPDDARPGTIENGRPLWTLTGEHLVTMRSDLPVIRVYTLDGALRREVRLPLSERQHTEEDIRREVADMGALAAGQRPGPMAITNELYPAGDTVVAMYQSARWRAAEDPALPDGRVVWRLVSIHGAYLGSAMMPEGFLFLGAGHGTVWGRVLDDAGVPWIVELALTPEGRR